VVPNLLQYRQFYMGSMVLRAREGGFSLLEVMIAMSIFVVVALGLAQLQISVIKQRIEAKKYAKALNYAEELMEKVRMTSFNSVNQSGMSSDITIPSPDNDIYERSLTTDSGSTVKLVTVKVKWKDAQGNFASRNSLQLSTKIWVFQ
jgi:prepilin-type N-terminal cleavage/methylation domain-containing protein